MVCGERATKLYKPFEGIIPPSSIQQRKEKPVNFTQENIHELLPIYKHASGKNLTILVHILPSPLQESNQKYSINFKASSPQFRTNSKRNKRLITEETVEFHNLCYLRNKLPLSTFPRLKRFSNCAAKDFFCSFRQTSLNTYNGIRTFSEQKQCKNLVERMKTIYSPIAGLAVVVVHQTYNINRA